MKSPRRLWRRLMTIGAYEGEPEAQAGRRRILVGYTVIGFPSRIFFGTITIFEGFAAAGAIDWAAAFVPVIAITALRFKPGWYTPVVHILLGSLILENLIPTLMYGGLLEADLLMAFTVMVVVGALIALPRRAAFRWFVAFLLGLVLAVVLPGMIDPIYEVEPGEAADIAGPLAGSAIFMYAGMAYFVRQRDRFQQQSDDLLHNILPDEIATRLKSDTSMIADDFPHASVLFADVVGFTPMSATMTPPQLVGRLNQVFTKFDEFVAELGLEKIKTIGDEYMVAAGVPVPRDDHAEAIAELALEIRDYMASTDFAGHRLELRIGIHSGPVVAGIIGTHKFAYDLWGDTVNVASRMESGGIPGQIQVTPATYDLLAGNGYRFEPRGTIEVKGKGEMETWLLTGKAHKVAPGTMPS
jgi:class 3 adenylate cyclase